MFVRAIGRISDDVEMLHIVREGAFTGSPEADVLAREQSAQWGFPVRVTLVAGRSLPPQTRWAHYGAWMFAVAAQPDYYSVGGKAQSQLVARALDTLPDLVFDYRLAGMCPVLCSGRRHARLFFDLDGVEHRTQLRAAFHPPFWPGKLAYVLHALPLFAAERKAAMLARATFVWSEFDGRHLRALHFPRIGVVPNASAIPEHVGPATAEPTLLLLGTYYYQPNLWTEERLINCI